MGLVSQPKNEVVYNNSADDSDQLDTPPPLLPLGLDFLLKGGGHLKDLRQIEEECEAE